MKSIPLTIFIIGVSGSGKSTIGRLISNKLNLLFVEADNYHSKVNIKKMSSGNPLSDKDRFPWIRKLNRIAIKNSNEGLVIACSALKEIYRVLLVKKIQKDNIRWVFLNGNYELLKKRLKLRKNHFMSIKLLKNQFDILEIPSRSININVDDKVEKIVNQIIEML